MSLLGLLLLGSMLLVCFGTLSLVHFDRAEMFPNSFALFLSGCLLLCCLVTKVH